MATASENAVRSPSYPSMSLADAITAAGKIEAQYRSSKVDREAGAKLIGYSGLSGPANKALAALAQYGLVERAGKGEMRVTDRARAILHPDNLEEKRRELRAAAMEPALFKEMQERWPNMIPPEDGVITYFNRRGFNPSAIRPAAKAYLQTLLFLEEEAASDSYGKEPSPDAVAALPPDEGSATKFGGARVGDWIDYESGGSVANPKPMRVRAVSDDGAWVFVDDSVTGLEMNQVVVVDAPHGAATIAERPTLPFASMGDEADKAVPGMRKAMFPLDEGDVTLVFPEGLTTDALAELGQYLDIFLKKEQRKGVKASDAKQGNG